MLPGISAQDCLFADLTIDPQGYGWQCFEATDFLVFKRQFDTTSPLILWQIGVVGDINYRGTGYNKSGLRILVEYLKEFYGSLHKVFVYEASPFLSSRPSIERLPLRDLHNVVINQNSTLYVPPLHSRPPDDDMLNRLTYKTQDLESTEK